MFQTKVREKLKAHILCTITFFESHAVYGTMRKGMMEPHRPQMVI